MKTIRTTAAAARRSTLRVALLWEAGPVRGNVSATTGRVQPGRLSLAARGPLRQEIAIRGALVGAGAHATVIEVRTAGHAFSFFLRDVTANCPIVIRAFGVAVVPATDRRGYAAVAAAVQARGLRSGLQRYAQEPEETYEQACDRNRKLLCPTWLGLSRDLRFFEFSYDPRFAYWGYIQPRYHSTKQNIPESKDQPYHLEFVVGPGASCQYQIDRRLEDGVLPILRSTQHEDDVDYHLTAFCTLETQPVSRRNLRGSDWRACYPHTGGNMATTADVETIKDLIETELRQREEETVCAVRVEAVNHGQVPRYAWFKTAQFQATARGWHDPKPETYDGRTGFARLGTGRVFAISRLNGDPLPQEEVAVLLPPGGTAVFEMLVPHQPLSPARAKRLARLDIDQHLDAARKFWRAKLAAGAQIHVPEPAIDERIRAGLLHCDVAALGKEPDGPVLATIGWYSPIGSESSPIIQFFDSMGWHQLAERSLEFFLERQREDGFIQNFGGYQLETGPALWSMGEHYRHTRDDAWVRRIKPKVLKACEFLLAWRDRNKKPALRGRGYGLLDGKVADPEDFFHSFMLNGLTHVGLARAAEMLAKVDPAASRRLAREAAALRTDIRTAFRESMARSPVVPLGDGTWAPSAPPWAEYRGPLALYADGGKWFTHGTFVARDSMIGALYLVIGEVLEPDDPAATLLLQTHADLMTVENAALSQPYYARHDYLHARRGDVNAFLKMYYNQFTALQDRQTYTFWEHYFHASQHKTHEEGWFLMQTRWMLWLEDNDTLGFLRAIPRRWLADGQQIILKNVSTYFGPASLTVASHLGDGWIEADVRCASNRRPRTVTVRLPHPEGRQPVGIEGGTWDAATETVRVTPFRGRARVVLRF
ncbi:hypothetical protein HQ590_10075 [bacterium]|nr:hypothetical protein [bacterium]